jgi:iron complex transport system substrate-binding protein
MFRKLFAVLALILSNFLFITACSPAVTNTPTPTRVIVEPTQTPVPIIDDLGRQVNLTPPARRIVTLGPSMVESLYAIGAGELIVGREEFSLYPPEAVDIPSIGSLFGSLPGEAILALEPDLVLAPEIISLEQVQALEGLGLTVYYQTNPTSFPELYDNLRELGRLTGREIQAEELIGNLEQRVEAVESALQGIENRPRVFYELDATDPQNPYTTGSGTFIDLLITMAGGDNIGQGLEGAYAQISSEQIILSNPEIILLADAEYGVTPENVASRPGWETIQAVVDGRLYPFDPNLGSIPGPRLVDGLETMARLFHPEVFEN